ncbi:MAG: hypothetical protein H0X24_00930 [Ktedonobacterales bacterium]|nr:hypothetical protein [Ktedonobacterales bacterium]
MLHETRQLMTTNDDDEGAMSLEAALQMGETGAQCLASTTVYTVFLPNRFNGRCYWFCNGAPGQPPRTKRKHSLLGGILTLVRLQGLNLTTGWQPI